MKGKSYEVFRAVGKVELIGGYHIRSLYGEGVAVNICLFVRVFLFYYSRRELFVSVKEGVAVVDHVGKIRFLFQRHVADVCLEAVFVEDYVEPFVLRRIAFQPFYPPVVRIFECERHLLLAELQV